MTDSVRLFIFLALLLASFAPPAHAQNSRRTSRESPVAKNSKDWQKYFSTRRALLIGVSQYEDDAWDDLEGVEHDLAEVGRALQKDQGYEVTTILNPTKDSLRLAVSRFIAEANRDKETLNPAVLIYFAGHGEVIHDSLFGEPRLRGFVAPANAPHPSTDTGEFVAESVNVQEFRDWARQLEVHHAMFVFDSCFGGMALSSKLRGDPPVDLTKPVRYFISAGGADESVPDESVFREHFVRALTTDVADGANGDGWLTSTELAAYLEGVVPVESAKKGARHHPVAGPMEILSISEPSHYVFQLRSQEEPPEKLGQDTVAMCPSGTPDKFADFERKKLGKMEEALTWWNRKDADTEAGAEITTGQAELLRDMWSNFLDTYGLDLSCFRRDDAILRQAEDRLEYWGDVLESKGG